MRKYNLEYVRKSFSAENYTLTSNDKYVNGRQKFSYICPVGHSHKISFNKWLEGRRCPYCDGQGKPTIEFIRDRFKGEGFILLTKTYINSKQKLEFICPEGHRHQISWHGWNGLGHRCPYCSGKYVSKQKIFNKIETKGYEVLNILNLYKKTSNIEIEYKCQYGHINKIKWISVNNTSCSTCAYTNRSGHNHPNWKDGISCEPYCDAWADKEYKEDIKARDNYECQNPDCWGTGSRLIIHHIDYNKKHCEPQNLITLCNSCNSRANFKRYYHKKFYRDIMKNKGVCG